MAERESTIISRMAGGDEKAFEELYNANARKVYAYLRSRNIDEETAADILQNTFLAAWRGAGRFQGGAKPLTWLIGIARHKLVDEIRVRERTRAAPLEAVERRAGMTPRGRRMKGSRCGRPCRRWVRSTGNSCIWSSCWE